jgi:hypothetical protein
MLRVMRSESVRGRYDAFVSYSHHADRELARNLQRAMERVGAPWYRVRSLRIFRDETDLTANPELWAYLTRALDASDFLVLLASPQAAASPWVNKEIDYWLGKRPASTVLLAVTGGELAWDAAAGDFDWQRTDCVPAALGKRFTDVPTAADLRGIEARKLGDPDFTLQAAKLVASIRSVPVRELYDAEMTRYRRRLRLIGATAVTLAALLVLVGWQLVRIRTQSRHAIAEALASRAGVEQASAPARAALLAATAVALYDSPRTRGQWITAAYGLADWTAAVPDARLHDFTDGRLDVINTAGELRALALPDARDSAVPAPTNQFRIIDEGRCIAEDYVTPAPQGGDVPVCHASEIGFAASSAGSTGELWLTVKGSVRAVRPAPSCTTMVLLQQNPIQGDISVGYVDEAFLRRNAHSSARTEDDTIAAVEPPRGWVSLGRIERPAATYACALLFLDSASQLRRWHVADGQSLVSDTSYGPVQDYRVSPDGRWIAMQHAGGRVDGRHADRSRTQPAQNVRWVSPLRLADATYRPLVLATGTSPSKACLRAVSAGECDVSLTPAPGVLGGDGRILLDVSRTGVEQLVVANFPGFVVCRPGAASIECSDVFGVERAAAQAVAISADAKRAAVAQGDAVKIFDLPAERRSLPGRTLRFEATRLAFDGPRLWLGGRGGLRVHEAGTEAIEVASVPVAHLVVLAGGGRVLLEDGGGQLRLAESTGTVVGLGSLPQPATVLAAAATSALVAVGQPDGRLILWDVERRSETARIATASSIRSAVFRSDDRELWFVTENGVTVVPTAPDVLLRRTCDAIRLEEEDWRQLIDQVPPVDPCVPPGLLARALALIGLR